MPSTEGINYEKDIKLTVEMCHIQTKNRNILSILHAYLYLVEKDQKLSSPPPSHPAPPCLQLQCNNPYWQLGSYSRSYQEKPFYQFKNFVRKAVFEKNIQTYGTQNSPVVFVKFTIGFVPI